MTFCSLVSLGFVLASVSAAAGQEYVSLGCWKDTGDRAIATLEGIDSRLTGNYQQRKNAVELCFEAAKSKGYPAFAVQYGGWCAASSTALETYKKYGAATNCAGGIGGSWANDVYKIQDLPPPRDQWQLIFKQTYPTFFKKVCQPGWKQHGDKCYKVFPEVIAAYADASEKCRSVQADVAALETQEENEFIKELLDEEQLPGGRDIWLSGRRQNEDSAYVWGTGTEMAYTDWNSRGQPRHQDSSKLCMQIYKNDNPIWQWYAQPCTSDDNGVLCEKEAN